MVFQIGEKKGHKTISCYNHHNEERFSTINDRPKWNKYGLAKIVSMNVVWYLNLSASEHVTANLKNLKLNEETPTNQVVVITNGKLIPILNSEETSYIFCSKFLNLKTVFHVPEIKKNLLSVNKFCKDNYFSMHFDDNLVFVKDRESNRTLITRESNMSCTRLRLEII